MNWDLHLFIGENHRLLEIELWREQDFRLLYDCWARLRSQDIAFALSRQSKHGRGESLRVEYCAKANYIEGKHDHTTGLVTLRVADDWLQDVMKLWGNIKPGDDKYANHQYQLNSRTDAKRGSVKRGYRLQINYGTQSSGIEQSYTLSRFSKHE